MDDGKENLPTGIITMMLTGYVKTIEKQHVLLMTTITGWIVTVIAFTAFIFTNR